MDRPHYLEFITHFDESFLAMLERFDLAFDKGSRAALRGESLTTCPHGLPDHKPNNDLTGWKQVDLLLEGPERAGWLLGWWAGYSFHGQLDPEDESSTLLGACSMAALLWYGVWALNQRKTLGTINEDELAQTLGFSVEEVRARAEAEGWPYLHKSKKPGQPILTVYPSPTRDTEKPS